ncbi:uncharacterized protein EV154DRAFT_552745 [Mucor mucedo]|uniref:uncharacterized protein n=1 Tax=Mucor mucedo TaxID=29922 RepID=UPI00221FDAB5|nr:uncharacterized protein EV154DRAFT_552745 [Mucor mucedo]KAI7889887.1 hypothetical protein EV154DRAFT_552745 [Mucor mucedo]
MPTPSLFLLYFFFLLTIWTYRCSCQNGNESWPRGHERYIHVTRDLYRKVDSSNTSTKLMIGSKSMNVLITISTTPIHSVGLLTNITLLAMSSSSSKLYLCAKGIMKLKESFDRPTSTPPLKNCNISHL